MKALAMAGIIIMSAALHCVNAQVESLQNLPDDVFMCSSHPHPGIVYLAGEKAVYKSYNDGDSWETVYAFDSAAARFFGMWFLDGQTGIATVTRNEKNIWGSMMEVPEAPKLYKTVDGGVHWQLVDSLHRFTKIGFVDQDTVFALEKDEGALYLSCDGGMSWSAVFSDDILCDYSVVDGHIVYALRGTGYIPGSTSPAPVVYKSEDRGATWTLILAADMCPAKGPKYMDQIYFYEDGKGVISGHEQIFTENDFQTCELLGTGFGSAPEDWNIQSLCLGNGFLIAISWNGVEVGGPCKMFLSRDFGRHRKGVGPVNPPPYYFSFLCDITGCEEDSTFFITAYNGLFRTKGEDFPNVGVIEKPAFDIDIYPNPVTDLFEISGVTTFTRIEVYDMLGKLNHNLTFERRCELSINTKSWKKGLYVLKIFTEKGVVTKKIVKS